MGHPRLGEMMSRQRLCDEVLLAPLIRCRAFCFRQVLWFGRGTRECAGESGAYIRRARHHPGEHYFQNDLKVLRDSWKDSVDL